MTSAIGAEANSRGHVSRRLVFISHANPEDNEFTTWLASRLAIAGYEVWSDVTRLIGGEIFWRDIEEAIRDHAAKFVVVVSAATKHKIGVAKEISVAGSVERRLRDFIIPVRVGKVPFEDFPISIHDKNAIDFGPGWHLGLARLLKKLAEDQVAKAGDRDSLSFSTWASNFLGVGSGMQRRDEMILSSWLSVRAIDHPIRFLRFGLTPKSASAFSNQWPCRLDGHHLLTFARAGDFEVPLKDEGNLKEDGEMVLQTFLERGTSVLPNLSRLDRAGIVVDLLRQSWELFAEGKGLSAFEMASRSRVWYFASAGKAERAAYQGPFGPGARALWGESTKLKAFWHYGLDLQPSVGADVRFVASAHVVFTVDGTVPIGSAARMHALRRRFCKSWWQDRWRDLMLAYLAKVGQGSEWIPLPLAPGKCVEVAAVGRTYVSPVMPTIGGEASSVVDDPDLLYDESGDREEGGPEDDEDPEEATASVEAEAGDARRT